MKHLLRMFGGIAITVGLATASPALAGKCDGLPTGAELQKHLINAATGTGVSPQLGPGKDAGGLFGGAKMWGAVVNRDGELCAYITSTSDPTQVWPGSQAIAKAKAYTANAFSLDAFVLSTARLYTFSQPGHSLFGLNNSNPFDPKFLAPPSGAGGGQGRITGGIITFGGGAPLYKGGKIIGGLGVSGDTACADHEVAKRVRDLANLNPGGGPLVDDIVYDTNSIFAHPKCINTKLNGTLISTDEEPVPLP